MASGVSCTGHRLDNAQETNLTTGSNGFMEAPNRRKADRNEASDDSNEAGDDSRQSAKIDKLNETQQPEKTSTNGFDKNNEIESNYAQSSKSTIDPSSRAPNLLLANCIRFFRFSEWWYQEIWAAALSGVCIATLVGVLVFMDGKSYSSWSSRVSPNAIVSVLVTIGKTAMMAAIAGCISQTKWNHYQGSRQRPLYHFQVFDEASRGPYGSVTMLYRIGPNLAMVGAILTVLSIAMDPFAQQILTYPSRTAIAPNETAYVQKAQTYYPKWLDDPSGSYLTNSTFSEATLDPSVQIAILDGLFGASKPLQPVCHTGDCEYPSFESLGFCSQCLDVTDDTNQECRPDPKGADLYLDAYMSLKVKRALENSPLHCTYTTPSGIALVPQWVNTKLRWTFREGAISVFRDPWTSIPASGIWATNGTLSPLIAGVEKPIIGFSSAKYEHSRTLTYTLSNMTVIEAKPNVTECAVYLCERKYEEARVSTSHPHLNASKSQRLTFGNSSFDNPHHDMRGPYYPDQYLVPPNGTTALSANATYVVHGNTLAFTISMLANLFNTSTTWDYDFRFNSGGGVFTAATALYKSPDLGYAMEQLATGLTDNVRTSKDAVKVQGRAYTKETYILVRWEWVVLPFMLPGLSIVFLMLTIRSTRHHGGSIWKSSALPPLLCVVKSRPPGRDDDLDALRKLTWIHETAKEMDVSIERDKDHQRLVFVEQ